MNELKKARLQQLFGGRRRHPARRLAKSETAVRSLLSRALVALSRELADHAPES